MNIAYIFTQFRYIFGGRSDTSGQFHSSQDVYLDDLKCLNLSNNRWSTVPTKGDIPCGRRSLTMWTYKNCVHIFGGYQSNLDVHYNDIYKWYAARRKKNGGVLKIIENLKINRKK